MNVKHYLIDNINKIILYITFDGKLVYDSMKLTSIPLKYIEKH
jgi:hypothetical protein